MKTRIVSRFVIALALLSLPFSPKARAVNPPPDGCYPNLTTAEGCNALQSLTTGTGNTAIGWRSLFLNTTGNFNTGLGAGALVLNTGDSNTATGAAALLLNTTGTQNTANGTGALLHNADGFSNTAVGFQALLTNTSNSFNTAVGAEALSNNTAIANTAVGHASLGANTLGFSNTAIGDLALENNSSGQSNTGVGSSAGAFLTTGNGNVCVGANVTGVGGESNTTRIRNIGSTAIVGGINVVTDALGGIGDGRLGFASSSRRYKQEVKPMDKASESLLALKPVTFRAKEGTEEITRVKHYGLIAEEVATVDPDLVVFNPEGRPETVRSDSINAMLLNEFLKEHHTVQEQGATIADLKKEIADLVATLKEQAAQIQNVNARLEVKNSALVTANK